MNNLLTFLTFSFITIVLLALACGGDSVTGPTTISNTTFTSIQQEVFTPTCAITGCHNGSERPNLSSGVAYNNIVNVQSTQSSDYVEPGDPDNSYLYRKITGVNISGVLMPRGGSRLSEAVVDSIRIWIENGALNN